MNKASRIKIFSNIYASILWDQNDMYYPILVVNGIKNNELEINEIKKKWKFLYSSRYKVVENKSHLDILRDTVRRLKYPHLLKNKSISNLDEKNYMTLSLDNTAAYFQTNWKRYLLYVFNMTNFLHLYILGRLNTIEAIEYDINSKYNNLIALTPNQ